MVIRSFKYRPQYPSSGDGMPAVHRIADFLTFTINIHIY